MSGPRHLSFVRCQFCVCGIMVIVFLATGCARSHRKNLSTANTATASDSASTSQLLMPDATVGEHLGKVAVIGTKQRFVLIETPAVRPVAALADGQALVCRTAAGVTATLRVSHERRAPFVVADVLSGEPHVGDEAFFDQSAGQRVVQAPQTAPAAMPPTLPPEATPGFRINLGLPPDR